MGPRACETEIITYDTLQSSADEHRFAVQCRVDSKRRSAQLPLFLGSVDFQSLNVSLFEFLVSAINEEGGAVTTGFIYATLHPPSTSAADRVDVSRHANKVVFV